MLPFLMKDKEASAPGVMVKHRSPDEKPEDKDDPSAAHEACGHAIIQAIKANDAMGIAQAIQDLMALGDMAESSEAPEKHSYADQNQQAGE